MTRLPAGTFLMGSEKDEFGALSNEKPTLLRTIKAFYLDLTEVTISDYDACVKDGACTAPTPAAEASECNPTSASRNNPVVCVSWIQARDYCAWRGGRLPTEPEWEFAARGARRSLFPWGDDAPLGLNGGLGPAQGCWGLAKPCVVGSDVYPKSRLGEIDKSAEGIYDLSGNVSEWVDGIYCDTLSASPLTDPDRCHESSRVVRGGFWGTADSVYLRSAYRRANAMGARFINVGIRCAQSE